MKLLNFYFWLFRIFCIHPLATRKSSERKHLKLNTISQGQSRKHCLGFKANLREDLHEKNDELLVAETNKSYWVMWFSNKIKQQKLKDSFQDFQHFFLKERKTGIRREYFFLIIRRILCLTLNSLYLWFSLKLLPNVFNFFT